jgi:hypothetical protein
MEEVQQIAGRQDFHAAVRDALAQAATAGWRELWLCDPDFANWPLGDAAVVESLTKWAGANRRLTLLALHFDEIARRHARWAEWRRRWSHVVHCRELQELQPDDVPVILHAPGALTVRLFDPVRCRGTVSRVPADVVSAGEQIDAVLQRSVEAYPATTMGL